MSISQPLVPRDGITLKVLIVARISGCQNQKELSLEDQVDHAKEEVRERYSGKVEFMVISTTGKGEHLDRPELAEVEGHIHQKEIDVLIMEDVGRMVRGTAAKEIWGMAVDAGIRCLAPNDGLDTCDDTWEEELIGACKDHVSHCGHTSRRIKQKQMNRFRRSGGALPLVIFGYEKPPGAKSYSDLRKDEQMAPFLREGFEVLRRTRSWNAVADYFNNNGVPVGQHCRTKRWDGPMVSRLFHNPLLKGKPQRGRRHTVKHNQSGKRISVINPNGPTYRDEPHLAYFDESEIDPLLAEIDAENKKSARKDVSNPFVRSRKRCRFPGRCAKCFYCGRNMVWGGNRQSEKLMCGGVYRYECWNSVSFDGKMLAQKVLDVISSELTKLTGFPDQFSALLQSAMTNLDSLDDTREEIERLESGLKRKEARINELLSHDTSQDLLLKMLDEIEQQKSQLIYRRRNLEARLRQTPQIPESAESLLNHFRETALKMPLDSFEFGDLLRQLVPEVHFYLVRSFGCNRLLQRAKVKLSLGEIVNDIDRLLSPVENGGAEAEESRMKMTAHMCAVR